MARKMTLFGCVPVTMNPPMRALSPVSTRSRVEMLPRVVGGTLGVGVGLAGVAVGVGGCGVGVTLGVGVAGVAVGVGVGVGLSGVGLGVGLGGGVVPVSTAPISTVAFTIRGNPEPR